MSKPKLPDLPQSIKENNNSHNAPGKCPPVAIILMLIAGIPAAILIRSAGHFVGRVIPYLISILPSILDGIYNNPYQNWLVKLITLILGFVFPILAFIVGLVWAVVYPAGLGGAVGYLMGRIAKSQKCRNGKVGFWLSVICGAVALIVFSYYDIQLSGQMHLSSRLFDVTFTRSTWPWWLFLLIGIDGLFFILGIFGAVHETVSQPFCEDCVEWYSRWSHKTLNFSLAEPLLATIDAQEYQIPDDGINDESHPHASKLFIDFTKCPSCNNDGHVEVSVGWYKKSKNEAGEETFELKTQHWFRTFIPFELSQKIIDAHTADRTWST
ncbi:MAG: hypothetical protein KC421_02445 [Anaerolineales bacterium]|nr:hypothetical protein [Anaerolineales bacterium]